MRKSDEVVEGRGVVVGSEGNCGITICSKAEGEPGGDFIPSGERGKEAFPLPPFFCCRSFLCSLPSFLEAASGKMLSKIGNTLLVIVELAN